MRRAAPGPGGAQRFITERVVQQLLDRGVIDRNQLDRARRTREFFGGEVVSHLFKLGFVDEDVLGKILAEVFRVPYASYDKLRAIADDARTRVPPAILAQYRCCPFAVEGDGLHLAMFDPRDRNAVRLVEESSKLTVLPYVAIEYRLYQALARFYRVPSPYQASGLSLAPPKEMRRRRLADESPKLGQVPMPAVPGDAPAVGLDGLPLDADLDADSIMFSGGSGIPEISEERRPAPASAEAPETAGGPPQDEPTPAPPEVDAPVEPAADSAPTSGVSPLTLTQLETALENARDRDSVGDALIRFGLGRACRACLFGLGADGIRGIAGGGGTLDETSVKGIDVPRDDATVLNAALDADGFYFGSVPHTPANKDLYSVLGGHIPPTVLILPIRLRQRTVALLYLDDERRPIRDPGIPLMRRVCLKAGIAFEIVLLRGKLRGI